MKVLLQKTTFLFVLLMLLFGCNRNKSEIFDEEFHDYGQPPGKNIVFDKDIMWNTVPVENEEFQVSPVSAINASRRVFDYYTDELIGKSLSQVNETIGFSQRSNYGKLRTKKSYEVQEKNNITFVCYVFDGGGFGWRYYLILDSEKKVKEIQVEGIE